MPMILGMGSFVMAAFAVLFLFYTNSFLIRRRNREFGLYNILGMGKGFYPGYTEEVHEIYRYSMEAKQPPRR